MMNACGQSCNECEDYKKNCDGCQNVCGKPYWIDYVDTDVCPIYNCAVNEKGYKSCGECSKLPCSIYYEVIYPGQDEKKIHEEVLSLVKKLKNYG